MANYRAVANGNWNTNSTWAGGAVPPDAAGHNIYSNGFTVTIDQNVNVALITNAAITASFVGGGTSAAVGGGFTMTTAFTLSGNIVAGTTSGATNCLTITGSGNTTITATQIYGSNPFTSGLGQTNAAGVINNSTGTITISSGCNIASGANNGSAGIYNNSTGTINISTATITGGAGANAWHGGIVNASTGIINITGSTLTTFAATNNSSAVMNNGAGAVNITTSTLTGGTTGNAAAGGIQNSSTGAVTITNSTINAGSTNTAVSATNGALIVINSVMTATNGQSAISSSATNRLSGTFVSATNGQQAVNSSRFVLFNQPTNAYIQHALDGVTANSFIRYYTSDNSTALNQAAPTDVRNGVAYGIGNSQTGRLTVPARGSVALSVNYGPSMPFTATVSGTTATATLAYSYPLVVGDQITVTGASNTEWNSTYTIASVVSGTSVTFTVPNTHSATAGTGAAMQTTGTAVLDPAAVASAVWGATSRTITGGLVDTATTLTNAPTVPSVVQIRQEMDSNSTKLANLDATVSSRLAPNGTLATVTTLTNAPTVPSASAIATAVWAAADKTGYSLTSAERTAIATAVEASLINENDGQAIVNAIVNAIGNTNLSQVALVAAIRSDLATELGRIDAAISSRAVPGDIPTETEIAAEVWAKPTTELTITGSIGERAKNQSTVSTTGAQLAAALS